MIIHKLGLEIRKLDLNNLYKDVDAILSNYGIRSGEINTTVQINATVHSLQKMLSVDSYLDVCCIRDCASLCQICISSERMKVYHTQHCVYWNTMLPDFRQMLVAMILDDFRCVLNPTIVSVVKNNLTTIE